MYVFDGDIWILVSVAVISIGISLYLRYLARNDDYWEKKGVPYIPRMNLLTLLQKVKEKPLFEFQLEFYQKYGKVYGSFEFSKPSLQVADPDLLRDILVKDFHAFSNRREFKLNDETMDNMVSLLKGEDWKRVRTIITPAFTSKRMRQMGNIINDCSKTVVETCEKHFNKNEPINVKGVFGAFTMDVIASAAFATKLDSHNDPENVFVKKIKHSFLEPTWGKILVSLILPLKVMRFLRLGTFDVTDFFRKITMDVIAERKRSQKRYNDVLQILMDATDEYKAESIQKEHSELHVDEADQFGTIISEKTSTVKYKKLHENELLAQCVLFFIVGYETSASTLSYLAYSLALNPDWQEKLIEEVDMAFKKHAEMRYDAVREMKCLDAILSEVLRLYPIVFIVERQATEDYQLGNTGITIEKGMMVQIPVYALHRDPEYFEEPDKFNPERFMDPSKQGHPQYAYLPFGAGPRNCLGMRFALLEIKLCISNILRHYRFRRAPNTKVPLEYKKGFGLMSVEELSLCVEKRSDVEK